MQWCLAVVLLFTALHDALRSSAYSHGRPQKFFPGEKRRHFAYRFRVAVDVVQMAVHKTLCDTKKRKKHKENAPTLGDSHKNALLSQD